QIEGSGTSCDRAVAPRDQLAIGDREGERQSCPSDHDVSYLLRREEVWTGAPADGRAREGGPIPGSRGGVRNYAPAQVSLARVSFRQSVLRAECAPAVVAGEWEVFFSPAKVTLQQISGLFAPPYLISHSCFDGQVSGGMLSA